MAAALIRFIPSKQDLFQRHSRPAPISPVIESYRLCAGRAELLDGGDAAAAAAEAAPQLDLSQVLDPTSIVQAATLAESAAIAEAGVGLWAPTVGIQQLLVLVQSLTGLDWWASIMLTTFGVRLITLPVALFQVGAACTAGRGAGRSRSRLTGSGHTVRSVQCSAVGLAGPVCRRLCLARVCCCCHSTLPRPMTGTVCCSQPALLKRAGLQAASAAPADQEHLQAVPGSA